MWASSRDGGILTDAAVLHWSWNELVMSLFDLLFFLDSSVSFHKLRVHVFLASYSFTRGSHASLGFKLTRRSPGSVTPDL